MNSSERGGSLCFRSQAPINGLIWTVTFSQPLVTFFKMSIGELITNLCQLYSERRVELMPHKRYEEFILTKPLDALSGLG